MRFLFYAEEFGIRPDAGKDCTEALAQLLETRGHDAEIRFRPGIYRFAADHAAQRSYAVSNSDPALSQNISILLEGCRNLFTRHCLTSKHQFCEGVISICPAIPNMARSQGFHRNIRIHDNVFYDHGVPLLYAHCTRELVFRDNGIHPWLPQSEEPGPLVQCRFCTLTETGSITVT